jgi:hypothetical protein
MSVQCQCAKAANQELFNYYSRDHYFQKPAEGDMKHCLWQIKSQIPKDALGVLPLVPGMRVMVTENIAVSQKVVNGTNGIVEKIIYDTHADVYQFTACCYIHVEGCGLKAPGLEKDIVPILPVTGYFTYCGPNGAEYNFS